MGWVRVAEGCLIWRRGFGEEGEEEIKFDVGHASDDSVQWVPCLLSRVLG